ncbi:hypothetical protein [Gemella sanguinis]|uniref:hypothetical protein n=1 Tax=Gemella sanguinis TaxID=84135 RepID=UPI00068D1DDD|nr:hypothetical protein [Gemella sanguinis]NKZ26063.1 hypothetical protein [Gemella sanguinis]
MKDMLSVILRIIIGIVAFFVIIIVFTFNYETGEDKGKIRKDENRIVEYIKEKVELENKEEIKKIKFIDHKKNTSTGSWKYEVIINDKIKLTFTAWRKSEEVYLSYVDEGNIKLIENKKNKNESNIEVIYEK